MNNDYFKLRENISYLSILLSFLIAFLTNYDQTYAFAFSWLIIIIILGNVRRIPSQNGFKYFIRMTLYFLPYGIMSMFLLNDNSGNYIEIFTWTIVSLIIGTIGILIKRKQIQFFLSETYIGVSKKQDKIRYALITYNLIGAAICEELYFRKFIITILYEYKYVAVLISSVYFFLSHYILIWGKYFKKKDFITQFTIGVISGTIYYFSGSIIPCIILHLIMNLPNIVLQFKCYNRHYLKKEHYDKLLENNCEDDLPI